MIYAKHIRRWALPVLLAGLPFTRVQAQEHGTLSGDFTMNFSAYDRDSLIGTNTTQYFHEKSSAEAWLFLNYRYQGYDVRVRFDLFNNSPLLNPSEAYTKQGLAFYSISKQIGKLNVTAGHFYDQFGTGIIFRAFEDRNLGLDYAIQGARVAYAPNDSFFVKAFTGQQKFRFDVWPQIIKGINSEKVWGLGRITMITGLGLVNRTLDRATMQQLAETINSWPVEQRFSPTYNVYAGSIYNTFRYKRFTLYGEYAHKTKDPVFYEYANGERKLENHAGNVIYGTLNYSTKGLGISIQYKKINTFSMRTSPYATLLNGFISYLPPLSRQHSYRLPARYSITAIPQGEVGYQAEVTYSPDKHNTFTANYSRIDGPYGKQIFREYYIDYAKKITPNLKTIVGIQSLLYDQALYQGKPEVPAVQSLTPLAELSYRFKPLKPAQVDSTGKRRFNPFAGMRPSLRIEAQYLMTRQDYGDFVWGLVELNLAPRYSFSFSDMINVKPTAGHHVLHYPTIFGSYTYNQTRFSIAYAKQVEGVVCTGGVCRVEPAFSGVRVGLSTNF